MLTHDDAPATVHHEAEALVHAEHVEIGEHELAPTLDVEPDAQVGLQGWGREGW